jgi:hypothetical protein
MPPRKPCNNMHNHPLASHPTGHGKPKHTTTQHLPTTHTMTPWLPPTGHEKPNLREKASPNAEMEDSVIDDNARPGLTLDEHVVVGSFSCAPHSRVRLSS